jgi:hypothetical protein
LVAYFLPSLGGMPGKASQQATDKPEPQNRARRNQTKSSLDRGGGLRAINVEKFGLGRILVTE